MLLITIKRGTICMSQRPIRRKNMNVSEFDSELYDTRIQYKNWNIHKHSLSFKGIQHLAMSIQKHKYEDHTNLMEPSFVNIFKHYQGSNKVNIESLQWSQLSIV